MYVKLPFIVALGIVGVCSGKGYYSKGHSKSHSKSKGPRRYRGSVSCPCFTKRQIEKLDGFVDIDCNLFKEYSGIEFITENGDFIHDVCSGPACTNSEIRGCFFSVGFDNDNDECYYGMSDDPISKREDLACRAILKEYCDAW